MAEDLHRVRVVLSELPSEEMIMQFKINRAISFGALIGALALAPASAFAGSGHHMATPAQSAESGDKAVTDVLHDMSMVMQHWMNAMSDPDGLSPADARHMAGAMATMSDAMKDMSSMMRKATGSGSESGGMMGSGGSMMSRNGHGGMMMNSQMVERMQRMHEQMQELLADVES
jgi:hypothetical protein